MSSQGQQQQRPKAGDGTRRCSNDTFGAIIYRDMDGLDGILRGLSAGS